MSQPFKWMPSKARAAADAARNAAQDLTEAVASDNVETIHRLATRGRDQIATALAAAYAAIGGDPEVYIDAVTAVLRSQIGGEPAEAASAAAPSGG